MNLVELELDETLADFEVQDWIDNVFSVQYPDIKARIKKGCSGLCHKKDEWHKLDWEKDYPKVDRLVRVRTKYNETEYICRTYLYIPAEDEIGYGTTITQFEQLNGDWVDDTEIEYWCYIEPFNFKE
jgi:hypothetical protein